MEITEVRIKLMEIPSERLQAFCSITFDDSFVIRDLKIIEGASGPFVAMPSRKLTGHCPQCGSKNHLRAAYCNHCGERLADDRAVRDEDGRAKLYADIAHPINSACREMIQDRVIREFRSELDRAKLPGYVSRYEDPDEDVRLASHPAHASAPAPHHRPSGGQSPASGPSPARRSAVTRQTPPPAQTPPMQSPMVQAPPTGEGRPRGPIEPEAPRAEARSATPRAASEGLAAPAEKRDSFGAGIL